MIELEPIPNSEVQLLSNIGNQGLMMFTCSRQVLHFRVRVPWMSRQDTILATGENLSDLEGVVTLHRGIDRDKHGNRTIDDISYNPPSEADYDEMNCEPQPASFVINLFLKKRLFDQVVDLSRTVGLPRIDLSFDYNGGATITFGDAPDGSEILWNNVPKIIEKIESATITHQLLDQINEKEIVQSEPLPPSEPPLTAEQIDLRIQGTYDILNQLCSNVKLLIWAVVGVGAILIAKGFIYGH